MPCECCSAEAVDLHHIKARGMGGTTKLDKVENIMALCRDCHVNFGDKKTYMSYLYTKHKDCLFEHEYNTQIDEEFPKSTYDNGWLLAQIYKYEFTCPVCKAMNCLDLEHLKTYSKLLTSNIK